MEKDRYIGRLLDNRYEILEVLGVGGMAVVYKARCHRLNRLVAIKILKAEYTKDDEFRRRFYAESQAVAMLSHPNIVSVYDVSTTDDADYIVMELIDGITLKQYMEKKGVLNWKETLHFAIQIAKALEHAHSRGIIHRDIKPHNVMVLKNGSVKVTDFGIAHMMSESNTLTKEALGSVHYISPEQAKGGRVDRRSDLYSLGVVMYEMTTGKPPYDGESPVAVAIQHINGKPTLPSASNPNIPGGLEQIIMRSMAHNPAARYPSAAALLTDLDEFRKNPTILFDYNNPDSDIDAAMRMRPAPRNTEETPRAKPVTERPVPRSAPPRSGNKPVTQPKKPTRQREVIVEEKEERSKVATIAIAACATVAIAAVILFCVAFFAKDMLNSSSELTVAPDLIGEVYDAEKDYGGFVIEITRDYSDEYAKGTIMDQTPKPNKQMVKGGIIRLVISYGPRPVEKVMESLIGQKEEDAKKFLDSMDLNLQVLSKWEYNNQVAEGCVVRTDPVEGEKLEEGQTISLWLSAGQVKETGTVPNVVGYTQERADAILRGSKFNNILFEEVESTEPKGKVLEQSVPNGSLVDLNTLIVLKISKGEQLPNVDAPPVIDPVDYVQKVVTIPIPDDLLKDCVLTIWNGTELVEERTIYEGTLSTEVKLWGVGKMTFKAMLDNNDAMSWEFEVDFGGDMTEQ